MKQSKRNKKIVQLLVALAVAVVLVVVGGTIAIRRYYDVSLRPLNTSGTSAKITIPNGATVRETAQILKQQGIIKSSWAFERYVRNTNASDKIKAGTYELSPSYSVSEIVSVITEGKVATNLVTILPGRRLDQVKKSLINAGFSEQEVDDALKPERYANHPALVDKPIGADLEGYLYPESFQRTDETRADTIIKSSLDEMQKRLTPSLRADITRQGLTVHEGIILASIVEKEAGNDDDKPKIAQVFIKRLKEGRKLESDATASYGAVLSGQFDELSHSQLLNYDSKYNTYLYSGLPPGPVSNVTKSSLEAVAQPSNTDYLYFVADDEGADKGRSFFSRTLQEHEALTREHCKNLCGN